jgi:hypothetical protein
MNDREKIIDKIKKCLRLSVSSNPHEAAAALRQATALMEKHGIDHQDILLSDVAEADAKSGAKEAPPVWESKLARVVANAFGCEMFFVGSWSAGHWRFIGCGPAPEIATYSFQVLARQCRKARADYIKTTLRRCKTATKTKRADLFCLSWVHEIARTVHAFAADQRQRDAIAAYLEKHYSQTLKPLSPTDRAAKKKGLNGRDIGDMIAGRIAAKDAVLNRGVAVGESRKALENKG